MRDARSGTRRYTKLTENFNEDRKHTLRTPSSKSYFPTTSGWKLAM